MGPFSSSSPFNLFSEIGGLGRKFTTTLPRGGAHIRWDHLRHHWTGATSEGCQAHFRNRDREFFIFVISAYYVAVCSEHSEALLWLPLLQAHSSSAQEELEYVRNAAWPLLPRRGIFLLHILAHEWLWNWFPPHVPGVKMHLPPKTNDKVCVVPSKRII